MSGQTEQIWISLLKAGIVQGDQPGEASLDSPWYVKVLLAISGWLAACFFLGFMGASFEVIFRHSGAACIVGIIMLSGAFVILRTPSNEFVENLGLAISLAGQALVIYTIFNIANRNETTAWLLVALMEIPLALVMPNFLHRVFSSFIAAIAFYLGFIEMGVPYIIGGVVMFIAALCWLNEFRYPQQMKKIRAIGYGLTLALIALNGVILFGYRTMGWRLSKSYPEIWVKPWIGEIVVGVVAIYVIWNLLQRYDQPVSQLLSITTLLGTILICAVSMKVQGITVGMVIVLLGFSSTNRVLLGLGITSLLFNISSFYYMLDTTLLYKSQSLLIVGLILLVIRWLMQRFVPMGKET